MQISSRWTGSRSLVQRTWGHLFCLLLLILICLSSSLGATVDVGRTDSPRVGEKQFLEQLKAALSDAPETVDRAVFAEKVLKEFLRTPLGFGYELADDYASRSKNPAYFFNARFLYWNGLLVGFRLAPYEELEDSSLLASVLGHEFPKASDGSFGTYEYRAKGATDMLPGCPSGPELSPKLKHFCSIDSGVSYGIDGGFVPTTIGNRKAYYDAAPEIDGLTCLRLLYSINPATRMTAYEHFIRNESAYADWAEKIEKRMAVVFQELPVINTTKGCVTSPESSQFALKYMLRNSDGGRPAAKSTKSSSDSEQTAPAVSPSKP